MSGELRRQLRVPGAVMLGLGSIVGTGVFISIGIAAGVAGPAVLPAIVIAALVAGCNGLSSAQLAANHPVSGGTYEYGYRFLVPPLGFTAGLLFLLAKSASAATASLGISGYILRLVAADGGAVLPLALAFVVFLTLIVAAGVRSSTRTNAVVVSISLVSLLAFLTVGIVLQGGIRLDAFTPFFGDGANPGASLLNASALMFVAYTGYGRIATLGEEVRSPGRTIPRAIGSTLLLVMLLYTAVAAVAISILGADGLAVAAGSAAAPLERAAYALGSPALATVLAIGAVSAMTGVLLNLLLGLSRVVLAMARRGDLPSGLSRVHAASASPRRAVFAVGILILVLVSVGDVRLTWSFSAFTVLVYYALTNLAALFIAKEDRLFPRWLSLAGLAGCLGLAAFIPFRVMVAGLAVVAAGLLFFGVRHWYRRARRVE